ncbi:MAG: signal peptidase II [Clostridiales bacterium]|jgi:signal peptidase II|nr:signal peptidase II [Clostridiales bacterium]
MVYVFIVISIVLLDTMIKNYMEKKRKIGEQEEILNGKIILHKHYNYGMILNFMDDKKEMVKTISCALLGLILLLFALLLPKKGNKLLKLGLSFVIGGAISNVSDRIFKGYVVDYFSFNCKKFTKLKNIIFNLSDLFIFLGSTLIALYGFFSNKEKRNIIEIIK